MRPTLPLVLATALTLTGCARIADSRLNPFNWFGTSQATAPVDANGALPPLTPPSAQIIDNRNLIASIASMNVDRTPEGAIVRATGIANTQGHYNAQLVPVGVSNGTLTLAFRTQAPAFDAQGTVASRQITAVYVLDKSDLATLRNVRVQSASNALISRR